MKFKNFDIADVIGFNDAEQAKAYTGKKGYYTDHIEQLDELIENKRHIGTLYSIVDKADTFERLIVGCEFDYHCPYTYFLPLDKVKKEYTCDFKAEPAEKDIDYRPCKNLIELMDLLDKGEHGNCLVGTTIYIKRKLTTKMIETSIITSVKRDCDGNWLLYLGDKFYSLVELFNCYDILLNGRYQPFGVKVNE